MSISLHVMFPSTAERQKLFDDVEKEWEEREKKANSSTNSGGSDVTEEDCETEASDENEECIVKVCAFCFKYCLQTCNAHYY